MSVLSKIRKIAALCCQTFLIASSFSKCKYFFTQRCSVEMSTKIKTLLIRSQWNQWLCYEFDINRCILLIVVIFLIYEYFNTVLITDLLLWPKPFSEVPKMPLCIKMHNRWWMGECILFTWIYVCDVLPLCMNIYDKCGHVFLLTQDQILWICMSKQYGLPFYILVCVLF